VRPADGQGGLADAGRAGDGRDRHRLRRLVQQPVESGQFPGAAGEGGHRQRQLGRDLGGRGHGRQLQRRVLPQDRRLQVAYRRAGVDPEVLAQGGAQPPVSVERVRLPPGPVQREHQPAGDLLVERVLPAQLGQLAQQRRVLAQLQPDVDELPPGPQQKLVEALRLALEAGQVGQRRPAPQRHRLAEQPGPVARVGALLGLPDQPLGGRHVGRLGAQVEQVAGRPGQDRVPAAEQPAQVGDVALEGVRRGGRGGIAPHQVGEPIGADDMPGRQGERRENRLPA